MVLLTGILAVLMSAVHVLAGGLRFLDDTKRGQWLSAAGGAAVAYVFVHILPELSRGQQLVIRHGGITQFLLEQHIYLIALAGLAVFYGLEKSAITSRRMRDTPEEHRICHAIYSVHILSFSVYNVIIGYLLVHRESGGIQGLIFFWLALTLHFLTNDYELNEDFPAAYKRSGRWILAGAVIFGWAVGVVLAISQLYVAYLFAFLAGGIILNVLKSELPEERQSDFRIFLLGVLAYTTLLLYAG